MIPVALITGFLGSGKTTLLQRFAAQHVRRRYVFLVNDFAQADVDGQRMRQTGSPVLSVVGGSIFCICKVTDFIERLNEVHRRFSHAQPAIDGLIVETSGMTDPRVAGRMLIDAQLDDRFELRSVISVVEPVSLKKLLATLPNMRSQIEAAQVVLINKVDLHDAGVLAETENALSAINPRARLIRTTRCDVDLDPLAPLMAEQSAGSYADCRDPHYYDVRVTVDTPLNLAALRDKVSACGESVFRVKGALMTDQGPMRLDYAHGRWCAEPTDQADGQLAIIGDGRAADILDKLAGRLSDLSAAATT